MTAIPNPLPILPHGRGERGLVVLGVAWPDRRKPTLSTMDKAPPSPRPRKPSLARLIAKAKQLGVDVTVEPDGAVKFHTGSATTIEINEWDEVLPHGKH
jgi:hypothetical protein